MLYVTTRNQQDVFTVPAMFSRKRAGDGGQFLPFHHPAFSPEEIAQLGQRSCNQNIALMLNRIFGTKLSGWDVDFAVGRFPVRVTELGHRILGAETWHNPQWNYARTENALLALLGLDRPEDPGSWCTIGIRIAVLFGLYGELLRSGTVSPGEVVDVSCVSGDFSVPISAWYARLWGLPIGSIICCCNENGEIWNLICHGQFRTDGVSTVTSTPEADVAVPQCLERLIHGCGGTAEVERYLEACRRGGMYVPADWVLGKLRDGLFVSVISSHRIESTIPQVYATHRYLMSPYSALAYAGLLDYRAKKGQLRHALVLEERSPVCDERTVCTAMGITPEQFRKIL